MEYLKQVGFRISALRKSKGITQDALAQFVGYTSRSTINKIEKGLVDIPQSKIIELAEALNTTPAFLMGWDEDEKNTPEEPKLTEGEEMWLELYHLLTDESKAILCNTIPTLRSLPKEKKATAAQSFLQLLSSLQ